MASNVPRQEQRDAYDPRELKGRSMQTDLILVDQKMSFVDEVARAGDRGEEVDRLRHKKFESWKDAA